MRKWAETSRNAETGGILVGHNVGKDIEVTGVSGPGPNAVRSATHFQRDTAYCRGFLAEAYKEEGADYVGEWHSHVVTLSDLSLGDIHTLARILVDPDYDFVTFSIFLVLVGKGGLELLVYVAQRTSEERINSIQVIELYRGEFPECGNRKVIGET
jgi:integrative and conjugative element protein (TIGR02256 family)